MRNEMTEFGSPEQVYVENSWYDGPRAGVADIQGVPHRFLSQCDEGEDECLGTFLVWPIEETAFSLEQEQWQIFVSWYEDYEAGRAVAESHPGNPGMNTRWHEINALLQSSRESVPGNARRAEARLAFAEVNQLYSPSGPSYRLSWRLL